MALTYDSFFHPFGKRSSVFNFKPLIDKLNFNYFDHISKDIYVSCVYNKFKDIYTFFFKIPSEKNDKYLTPIYFDVVLEFTPKNKEMRAESTIKNYDIRIYSNSPNFMFTFTYVLKKSNSLPKCLPDKVYSKMALRYAPTIKNTNQIMTIEKTTYFSLFHLDYNSYLNKELINKLISKETEKFYINKIINQEQKLKEIRDNDKLVKENNTEEKKKNYTSTKAKEVTKPKYMEDSISFNMRVQNLFRKSDADKILADKKLIVNEKFYKKLNTNALKTSVLKSSKLNKKK